MPLENVIKLFRTKEGKEIKYIRVSTLAHYYFCAVQAWLQAQGIESPPNEKMIEGKAKHDEITNARKPTKWEEEFEAFLNSQMIEHESGKSSTGIRGTDQNKVLARPWYDGTQIVGAIVTHGLDDFKVYPDRKVKLYEYKFTGQNIIDWYKLSTAMFQMKVTMWLYDPILRKGNYQIVGGQLDFFNFRFKPLGTKEIIYDQHEVENAIAYILYQFNNPSELLAPARWKCVKCPEVFKNRCPFQ
jgi:hypothetical protein